MFKQQFLIHTDEDSNKTSVVENLYWIFKHKVI